MSPKRTTKFRISKKKLKMLEAEIPKVLEAVRRIERAQKISRKIMELEVNI